MYFSPVLVIPITDPSKDTKLVKKTFTSALFFFLNQSELNTKKSRC